jgi:hypothetical protein
MVESDIIVGRYICSAKLEVGGGDTRYLIREVYSLKTGKELKDEVIGLFVKDAENPGRTDRERQSNPGAPGKEDKAEKVRQISRMYIRGKLTNLSIEPLREREKSYRDGEGAASANQSETAQQRKK